MKELKKEVEVFWKFLILYRCMRPEIINIPYALMKRCKRDKVSFEMLACASLIKQKHPNSVLYLTPKNVMKCFGVSFRKAKKLIDSMKESDLFIYNPTKNCVFAKSFKSGDSRTFRYGKNGRLMVAFFDRCFKAVVSDDDTLRTRLKQMRYALIVECVYANSRSRFNVESSKFGVKSEEMFALTHTAIGKTMGMSKSSGRRYTKDLIDQKRVSKSGIVAERVIDELNSETESEWRKNNPDKNFLAWHSCHYGGWSGWRVYGCVYTLESMDDLKSMVRVIWNHRRRVSTITTDDDQSCSGYYGKMEKRRTSKKFFVYA